MPRITHSSTDYSSVNSNLTVILLRFLNFYSPDFVKEVKLLDTDILANKEDQPNISHITLGLEGVALTDSKTGSLVTFWHYRLV